MGSSEQISIACVQARVTVDDFVTEAAFRSLVDRLMDQAVAAMPAEGPRLVVFPEDFASGCMFVGEAEALRGAHTLRAAVEALVKRHLPAVVSRRLRHRVGWVRALALHLAPAVARLYTDTFSTAARKYGAYVLAGTVLLPDLDDTGEPQGGDVYNTAFFYGPDGRLIGTQRKAFLIDLEGPQGLDLSSGAVEALTAWDTELGRVGVAICFDAFQGPVIDRLAALDLDLLLKPSANPGPWSEWQQEDWLNGMWQAVCRRGVARYGVNPMLVGHLLDVSFEGQSSIVQRVPAAGESGTGSASGGPLLGYAALPPRPGFVRVARSWTEEEVLVATLPHPRRGAAAPPPA
ncbi:MAG: carbon-nitrogen hydrolase family protein [Limnochordales bacterium]|nr:carbon-nitrogen hydrolase family protein [Limnochordales bacterium]